jgi:hypothetical protein
MQFAIHGCSFANLRGCATRHRYIQGDRSGWRTDPRAIRDDRRSVRQDFASVSGKNKSGSSRTIVLVRKIAPPLSFTEIPLASAVLCVVHGRADSETASVKRKNNSCTKEYIFFVGRKEYRGSWPTPANVPGEFAPGDDRLVNESNKQDVSGSDTKDECLPHRPHDGTTNINLPSGRHGHRLQEPTKETKRESNMVCNGIQQIELLEVMQRIDSRFVSSKVVGGMGRM